MDKIAMTMIALKIAFSGGLLLLASYWAGRLMRRRDPMGYMLGFISVNGFNRFRIASFLEGVGGAIMIIGLLAAALIYTYINVG